MLDSFGPKSGNSVLVTASGVVVRERQLHILKPPLVGQIVSFVVPCFSGGQPCV